jgi:hypothetical protein
MGMQNKTDGQKGSSIFLWPKGKYKFFYGQKGIFSFLYVYGHALANAAFLDGCDLVPDACGATGASRMYDILGRGWVTPREASATA